MEIHGKYFYGNEISEYGQKNGYVDYRTLAKAFDAVLNNDIMSQTNGAGLGWWEQVSGMVDFSEEIDELREQLDEIDENDDEKRNEIENKIEELEEEQDRINYEIAVYQWYIVSDWGAEVLQRAGEIVYYNEALDMYLWGVTHFGTSWDYVLTDIKIVA